VLEILGHKPHDIRRVRFDRRVDQAKTTAALARQLLPKD